MFKNRHMLFGLIIILVSIIIDQLTKGLALINLPREGSFITVIPNFFNFELHFNNGAAWSSFSGNLGFLVLMTLIAVIAFTYFFKSVCFKTKLFYSIGISLMFGGLFGNFIDRLFRPDNSVVDFLAFDFGSYSFPIFNIADCCLVIGVALFIIDILFLERKREDEQLQD